MAESLIGTTLGGCEILEVIGRGGMGVIFRARQKSLDRIVAMKILSPKLADDALFVQRFHREARSIARVNHPNILAVYDVGTEKDIHYMIMELIEGESLAEVQTRIGGPMKLEDACAYIKGSALGLEAAHAAGITHRDIKPENLMLTKKGVIKVSDFGLAKEADNTGHTSTDAVMGTPAFMSPEQCDGKKVDGRTDIYSLGGTFYKLLTGRLPFEAETAMSMMYRHKHEALVPPRELIPTLPDSISQLVTKMMAKKPDQRAQTMGEVSTLLDKALVDKAAPPPPPGGAGGRQMRAAMAVNAFESGDMAPPPGMTQAFIPAPRNQQPAAPASAGERSSAVSGRARGIPTSGSSSHLSPPGFLSGQQGEDPYQLVTKGDEMLSRGDRAGALKNYKQALGKGTLDPSTQVRIEQAIANEIELRRKSGEALMKKGAMVEAGREYRLILDIDPKNDQIRNHLKEIDEKLASKRTLINDIRTAISASQFESAIQLWDRTPSDLRDESIGKQIEHLRHVVVPSNKLSEQGEKYNEAGRIEEALSTFEDALRIDPNCERARIGLNEVTQKINRIDSMLREGYELSMKQDHAKAIEMLVPILTLRPGHPQALKTIVDIYVAVGQEKRQQGDLKGAAKSLAGAREYDPQNKGIIRQHEEVCEMQEKEQALIDRATEAFAKGKRTEAIKYWQEVVKLNPANRTAKEKIVVLSKDRSSRFVKFTAISAAVLIVGAIGYQFVREKMKLDEGQTLEAGGEFEKALQIYNGEWFVFNKDEVVKRIRLAKVRGARAEAERLEKEGKYPEAITAIRELIELLLLANPDPKNNPEVALLESKALTLEARVFLSKANEYLETKNWLEATNLYRQAAEKANDPKAQAVKEGDAAVKSIKFCEWIGNGFKYSKEGNRNKAIQYYEESKVLAVDPDPKIKAVKEKLVQELKDKLGGYDPDGYEKHLATLTQALEEPWRSDALTVARKELDAAEATKPNTERINEVLKPYLEDMENCAKDGMVLFNRAHAQQPTMTWNQGNRSQSYCIDRYEYPNKAGELPKAGVTWLEAKNLCERANKQLCSVKQWKDSCQAKEYVMPYTFGLKVAQGTECNWSSGALKPSGSFQVCHNAIGAFDMNGNVSEWTLDGGARVGESGTMGGGFNTNANDGTCFPGASNLQTISAPDIGFRCCRPLQ